MIAAIATADLDEAIALICGRDDWAIIFAVVELVF
jgi:hypothetical protein